MSGRYLDKLSNRKKENAPYIPCDNEEDYEWEGEYFTPGQEFYMFQWDPEKQKHVPVLVDRDSYFGDSDLEP